MLNYIHRLLWPFPMEECSGGARFLRSCGKRLTCLTAAIEGGYQVPSPSQQREIHDEYTEIANKYFEDSFRKPLTECMKRSISSGVSMTDYYCLHRYICVHKPRRVLELGCGISSFIFANAFAENTISDPACAGNHLHSMEHLEKYFADVNKVIPDDLKSYVTFHLSMAEVFYWRDILPTSSYMQLPDESFQLLLVDGPPAEGRSNGDMFKIIEKSPEPVDVILDKRVKTTMTLDRYLPKGTVWFDYAQELGFARGVTADMLLKEPRMIMPLRHRDIFKHFDLTESRPNGDPQ